MEKKFPFLICKYLQIHIRNYFLSTTTLFRIGSRFQIRV